MLIEVTEEEYEKIKNGDLDKTPDIIFENREIPVIMKVKFKYKEGETVTFKNPYSFKEEMTVKGKIAGYLVTKDLPNGKHLKTFAPVYLISFEDSSFGSGKVFISESDLELVRQPLRPREDKKEALCSEN